MFSKVKNVIVKSSGNASPKNTFLRNGLVVIQFSISSLLIFGTMVVYEQLHFTQSKDLGFDRENILVINNAQDLGNRFDSYKKELSSLPDIAHVSAMSQIPSDLWFPGTFFSEAIESKQEEKVNGSRMLVDRNALTTLGIELIEGRIFNPNSKADSLSILLNETAVKELGFKDPIGKKVSCSDGMNETFTVIGVVKDFHLRSLRHNIIPTALHLVRDPRKLVIRYQSEDLIGLLNSVESSWKKLAPDKVIDYGFVTDQYDRLYRSEKRLATIFNIFVVLAIVIASLGLLGLSATITIQRRKEIGIRKVHGATIRQLIIMLNLGLTRPVILGLFIGLPTGFIAMNTWLEEFAYRIDIDLSILILTGLICVTIAWLVITTLTFRSARANPTENLKYE